MTTGIRFRNVRFSYDSMSSPLFEGLSLDVTRGWTGVVGANGVGKTTLLKLATGLIQPDAGEVLAPGKGWHCPQRTDEAPPGFEDLVSADDGSAHVIRGRLGIEDDWVKRWCTLSHGERKRAQIGALLWLTPAVAGVDEPTNHIDAEARAVLASALKLFRGVGLLVSHDRALLDALCRQCIFLDPPNVRVRPGGYSQGAAQAEAEQEQARAEDALAKKEVKRLKREARRRQSLADKAVRLRSKRGLAIKDHDARTKIDQARLTGKDAVGGKLVRQMQTRVERIEEHRKGIAVKKSYETGIWMPTTACKRDTLFRLEAGRLPLGDKRYLSFGDLVMMPGDRIALTGPNGTGKTTLIRHIVDHHKLHSERVTYLPQEVSASESRKVIHEVRALTRRELGTAMTMVSRLGSRPERLLETDLPSPGEVRKLLLALGVAREPWLIVMDEPTNHLDLVSIRCLEEALSDCPAGLLLVSHDRHFLEQLACKRWLLTPEDGGFKLRQDNGF
jgi:ATPase subunit of ABC transporter with duplicated ATPase domains